MDFRSLKSKILKLKGENMTKIKAYKNKENECSNFIIQINDSFFEMSNDAHMPNGVNMYLFSNVNTFNNSNFQEISWGDLPRGVLRGIITRLTFILDEN